MTLVLVVLVASLGRIRWAYRTYMAVSVGLLVLLLYAWSLHRWVA